MTEQSANDSGAARWARFLTGLYAVATVAAIGLLLFGRHSREQIWEVGFGLLNVPVEASFPSVVVVALTARALVGRKRLGLFLVAIFQLTGIYVGVVSLLPPGRLPTLLSIWGAREPVGRTLDVVAAGVAMATLVLLWRIRHAFTGRLNRGSWMLAAATLVIGTAVTGAVMWLLLGGEDSSGQQLDSVVDTVTDVLGGRPHHRLAVVHPWAVMVTELLAGLTVLAATVIFLASARPLNRWSPRREVLIRSLLADYGAEDSLGYFATRRDKSSIFSPDGRAAVTYRVIAGVSLASADPIGARSSWPAAIEAWRAEARTYGWQPAALGTSEAGARAYAAAGLRVLLMGDEAVLDTHRFDPNRASMAAVRRAAGHARRAAATVRIRRQADLPPAQLRDILALARSWSSATERGFSMALDRDDDPADARAVLVTAQIEETLVGILRFVPWGHNLSLDLMRRAPGAPAGVTELMVTELMRRAERLGIRQVSMNFCMFRDVFAEADRIGGRSVTRLNAGVLGLFDRVWQLERLYRSNKKYEPRWVPRFLCYDDVVTMPRVVLAAAAAEGFLRWPPIGDHGRRMLPPDIIQEVLAMHQYRPDRVRSGPRVGDQTRHRIGVIERMRSDGLDPYPAASGVETVPIAVLQQHCEAGRPATVVGRVRSIRDHGGVVFIDLADGAAMLQVILEAKSIENLDRFTAYVDQGDLLSCTGLTDRSRNGTTSLVATGWRLEAKSLHPVPWRGLSDSDARLRHRSADLITRPDEVEVIRQRSAVLTTLRRSLQQSGFLEVETPILQTVHGGARARPFRTRMNAYGLDLSLRIAPELYLKRLLVGGVGPVFEIGRNFRNEGADSSHNPEFTSLEAYLPGADYQAMLHLTHDLICAAATAVHGRPVLPAPGPAEPGRTGAEFVDISGPWPAIPMLEAVSRAVGQEVGPGTDIDLLLELAAAHGIEAPPGAGPGAVLEELYAELVEPATIQPTFYLDFPQETSPLTRPHRRLAGLVERWDLVIGGVELGTAYTELTDPVDQRRRLTEQSFKAAAGDLDAMEVDAAFLEALELGMPPTGGMGLGVDRLLMLLTDRPIRSVLAFPFVRPGNTGA